MRVLVLVLVLVPALPLLTAAQEPAASIHGHWRSPGGNSIIAVAPCGDKLCGTVAWASDRAKKDAAKTTNQLVGTQILTDLQQDKKGRWQGKLFIPDKNMRVRAKIQVINGQQLKVSGCVAGKSLCKSGLWTRTGETPPASD